MKNLTVLFIFSALLSCSQKYDGEVHFKSCKVRYKVIDEKKEKQMYGQNIIGNQWRFESAKQELALCLCEKYLQNQDEEIKEKILEIYTADMDYFHRRKSFKRNDFDSILVNRKEIFDYRILVE